MRIGIEAQRLFRRKKHGMEVVTLELIKHLQHIDPVNEYVVFVKDDEDANCVRGEVNFEIRKTPVFSYPYWEQLYLPKIAKEAQLDLLHCTSNTAPVFYKSPMVLTLHDIIYLEKVSFAGNAYQNFGNLYRKFIVPKVIRQCDQIITVSEFEKSHMVRTLGLPEEKVQVVYNAMNESFQVIQDQALLSLVIQKYKLPDQFILFFGNTAPKKNTHRVLEAYVRYCLDHGNPLPLVITDCTEGYIEQLFKRVPLKDRSKIWKYIRVLDHIPFHELPSFYNLATLFLYPSLRESFGMPIIEAMACGTPVITSDTSSMPEVAGGAAQLISPEKVEAIKESIEKVLRDEQLRQNMISKGLARAKEFSWEKTAQQVLQIYKKCVA